MPKIVLTDFISEISGISHYAVLMIPTGGGICVIGAGMLVVPGVEYLWRAGMLVFSFRGACKLQILASLRMFRNENQYILPVMSVSLWAVFETIKKRRKSSQWKRLHLKWNQLFGCLFGYLLGVKYALVPHLDWTHFNFPTSIHAPFHMEFPSLMSRLVDEGSDLKKGHEVGVRRPVLRLQNMYEWKMLIVFWTSVWDLSHSPISFFKPLNWCPIPVSKTVLLNAADTSVAIPGAHLMGSCYTYRTIQL